MPPKKVSLQDIAARLGVSKALVSFVLAGKGKEHRISEQMIKQVFEVAKEMNYRPNHLAKWLRTGKTQTIGLIIADISNPFFGKLGREIEREASAKGYKIIFCSSDEKPEKSEKQIDMLLKSNVDGIIIAPPGGSIEQIKTLAKMRVPHVLIDRYFEETDSNYVVIDNFAASYKATGHLLGKGYRNIAFLTVNDELVTMHDRTEGYLQALKDAGIEPRNDFVWKLPFSHDKKDVETAITQLTSAAKKIQAILFASSKIGLMGLETIAALGLKIPDDLAVASFDDPDFYKVCFSPVTAIAQPIAQIAQNAVHLLNDEIESGARIVPAKKIVLGSNLVIRQSSGY